MIEPTEKQYARVVVPAHIYIAVEMTDDSTDAELIAAARQRISSVETQREYLELPGFEPSEHVVVYPSDEPAAIDDRNW